MNTLTARKILGLYGDTTESELKKRYRDLVHATHPDAVASHNYPYEVNEINVAYEYLLEHAYINTESDKEKHSDQILWNAPENPNAYAKREIYQYCEDSNGEKIGFLTVAFGKYMWIPDEDFALFLKSLYVCAKSIIEAEDIEKGKSRSDNEFLMAEITYLLTGQFFGADSALALMEKTENDDIYYTKAMLELNDRASKLRPDSLLFPKSVREHKLYMGDENGKELGYLTFSDDRLTIGLIPLFERRVVQIKANVTGKRKHSSFADIDFYVKLIPENETREIDSINLKIREVLEEWRFI